MTDLVKKSIHTTPPAPQLAGRVTFPHFIPPLLFYRVCASCLVVAADPY
jgi:hypothetical protein